MKKSVLRQIIREEIHTLTGFKAVDPKRETIMHRQQKYTATSDKGNIRIYFNNDVIGDGDFDRDADGFFITFPQEHKSGQHGFDNYSDIVDYAIKHHITRAK